MKLRFVFLLLFLSAVVCPAPVFALWPPNGVALCTVANAQLWPAITTDGAAGAIVAWYDRRNGSDLDIYVQRVNAMGLVQWTADGVALCLAADDQINPTIASDGAGGAIVTWWDFRNGTDYDIYAQQVNAAGAVQWTANGVALCTARNDQRYPVPTNDGAGGFIVAWDDIRSGGGDIDIYAQRISAAGAVQWTGDGVALCIQPFIQYVPQILSDGVGGAFVTWADFRSGTDYDVYAQRVDGSGSPLWATNGVSLTAAPQNQTLQTMAPDGAGGAIMTWEDLRNPITGRDIYAQRINAAGAPQWTLDGVPVCVVREVQFEPVIVPDGSNGAIIAWSDARNGSTYDIFVQRVGASGTPLWSGNGVAICFAANSQFGNKIVSDDVGGAIVAWHDYRSGPSPDIYAQRIGPSGLVPTAVRDTPSIARVFLSPGFPNPFADQTSMQLDLHADATVKIEVHDVTGRLVRRVMSAFLSAGPHHLSFDGRDDAGRPLPSGVYFYSVRAGGEVRMRKLIISR